MEFSAGAYGRIGGSVGSLIVDEFFATPNFQLIVLDKRIHEWGGLKQATPGSAAYDVYAAIEENVVIAPGETVMISTGMKLWIRNPRYVGLMLPRSGLGSKQGLVLANGTGVVDSDYQGEWKAAMWNRGHTIQVIHPGQRIAQFVLMPVIHPQFTEVDEFTSESARGAGGFGSTGTGA